MEAAKTSELMLKLEAWLSCLIPLGLPPVKGRGQSCSVSCLGSAIMNNTCLAGVRNGTWPPSLPQRHCFTHGPLILFVCPSVICYHSSYLWGLGSEPKTGKAHRGERGRVVSTRQTGHVTAFPPRGLEACSNSYSSPLPKKPYEIGQRLAMRRAAGGGGLRGCVGKRLAFEVTGP